MGDRRCRGVRACAVAGRGGTVAWNGWGGLAVSESAVRHLDPADGGVGECGAAVVILRMASRQR